MYAINNNNSQVNSTILTNEQLVEKYSNETAIIINGLYQKYQDDPYMLSKTKHLLCNQLSNMLDNIEKTHEANQQRFEVMNIEKTAFVETFLNNNQYFYNSPTENFFFYDGQHYQYMKEDDILHRILTTISQGRQLMSWKQKTRMNIMKRIKETNILKSVPESETIQFVLDLLYPAFFSSKNEAKYFLIILGDSLFKKNTNLFHFIKPCSKNFIHYLNELSIQYLGERSIYNTFKYKYHDHEYKFCRFVSINDSIKNEMIWKPLLKNYVLDILCTASHYSTRYNNSDDFIINCNDITLYDKTLYLQNRLPIDMVKPFILSYLQLPRTRTSSLGSTFDESDMIEPSINYINPNTIDMTWKNMLFLWKHYLDSINLPAIMFQQTLKQLLIEHLSDYYNPDTDLFKGIFSKYLPFIQRFMQFWDETVIEDEMENSFEIEELSQVFKYWTIHNNETSTSLTSSLSISQLNDRQILDIISYYYPSIVIDQDKYIHHIRSSLWDKQMDIQLAMDTMQNMLYSEYLVSSTICSQSNSSIECCNTSIYDMYIYYCKYYSSTANETKPGFIVSKAYFDKYILEHYTEFVIDNTMLSSLWTK
jgi:hypothetical protein